MLFLYFTVHVYTWLLCAVQSMLLFYIKLIIIITNIIICCPNLTTIGYGKDLGMKSWFKAYIYIPYDGHAEKMINYNEISKKKFISNNPHFRKFLIIVKWSLAIGMKRFCWFIGHNNDILSWCDLSDIQRKWEYENNSGRWEIEWATSKS